MEGHGGTAGKGPTGGCVDLSHFDDTVRMKWDLHVIGTGFEADEGNTVRVIVTLGKPSYGLAEAAILNGSFDIVLPGTIEPYTGIGVYIDRNRDNACNVDGDSLWQRTTGAVSGDHVWEVTPHTRVDTNDPPCNINGIFDLTAPLPCP